MYHYEASIEELEAAKILLEKGWRVDKPLCPKCHGFGWVYRVSPPDLESKVVRFMDATATMDPCPEGCPMPVLFY